MLTELWEVNRAWSAFLSRLSSNDRMGWGGGYLQFPIAWSEVGL